MEISQHPPFGGIPTVRPIYEWQIRRHKRNGDKRAANMYLFFDGVTVSGLISITKIIIIITIVKLQTRKVSYHANMYMKYCRNGTKIVIEFGCKLLGEALYGKPRFLRIVKMAFFSRKSIERRTSTN